MQEVYRLSCFGSDNCGIALRPPSVIFGKLTDEKIVLKILSSRIYVSFSKT